MSGWRKSSRSHVNGNCVEIAVDWRKSIRSMADGNCVEIATDWRRSSRSLGNGNCVEAASESRTVLVRDTVDRKGPVLSFHPGAWEAFAGEVRDGRWTA